MPIHVQGSEKDVAKVVLLPGDPQRAEYIAQKFLENPHRYTDYRLMYGYTGTYCGKPISVQTSGMGTPSLSIVVEELNMLKARTLIRVGTCGAIHDSLKLGDVIVATAAHSSHDIFSQRFSGASFSATGEFDLTYSIASSARAAGRCVHTGPILTSEVFYEETLALYEKFASYGTLAVEMEAYALFGLGAKLGLRTGTVLTVSDIIAKQQRAPKDVIQSGVDTMVRAVLDAVVQDYDRLVG